MILVSDMRHIVYYSYHNLWYMLYGDNFNVTSYSLQDGDENSRVMNDHQSACGDGPPTVLVTAPPNQGMSKIIKN